MKLGPKLKTHRRTQCGKDHSTYDMDRVPNVRTPNACSMRPRTGHIKRVSCENEMMAVTSTM